MRAENSAAGASSSSSSSSSSSCPVVSTSFSSPSHLGGGRRVSSPGAIGRERRRISPSLRYLTCKITPPWVHLTDHRWPPCTTSTKEIERGAILSRSDVLSTGLSLSGCFAPSLPRAYCCYCCCCRAAVGRRLRAPQSGPETRIVCVRLTGGRGSHPPEVHPTWKNNRSSEVDPHCSTARFLLLKVIIRGTRKKEKRRAR